MTSIEELIKQLDELERKLYVFYHLVNVLELDADTAAPQDTAEGRMIVTEYLSNEKYKAFASKATGDLLRELNERKAELPARSARQAEFLLREYDQMKAIPQEEFVAYNVLLSDSGTAWIKCKRENDFAGFEPYLEKIFNTLPKFVNYWDPQHTKKAYDVLLNQYDYGMTSDFLDKFFAALKKEIVPLVKQIADKGWQPRDDFMHRYASVEKQRELSDYLMNVMTIDRSHCGIAETEHPFTLNFNKDDVRITTHYYTNDVMSSFYSVMHEGGHALYELHTGDDLRWTSLAAGASCAIHESQSRFFENIIGRSKGWCHFIFPKMQELFPENFADVTADEFYAAANRSEPSLIRIESDELTYCLHIMVRYEIEKALINHEIRVSDLPQVWNAKMKEYLGVDVPDDTHGVLQDSHWSQGNVGYFPSYALGNAFGAQIAARMKKDLDLDACTANGDLAPVVNWLTDHLFKYGCMLDPMPLLEQVCGEPFTPDYYIQYLKEKFSAIYGL